MISHYLKILTHILALIQIALLIYYFYLVYRQKMVLRGMERLAKRMLEEFLLHHDFNVDLPVNSPNESQKPNRKLLH